MIELSNGQKRVIAIAQEVLKTHQVNPLKEVNNPAYQYLLAQLATDPVITNAADPTGSRIIETKGIARAYIDWIQKGCRDSLSKAIDNFSFNRMVFGGSIYGSLNKNFDLFVYQGGQKSPTTAARSVLNLVLGNPISTFQMQIRYFSHSGVLDVIEGNHRLLGYKLVGACNFPVSCMKVYEETRMNEALNQALLELEALLPSYEHTISLSNEEPINKIIDIANELKNHIDLVQFVKVKLKNNHISNSVTIQDFENLVISFRPKATIQFTDSVKSVNISYINKIKNWLKSQ